MPSFPQQNEALARDTRVTQTDRTEQRTMRLIINKGGAANQDPRHRSRLKQLEDLRSHLLRLGADVDDQIAAERSSSNRAKPVPHNTIMCVPNIVNLLFLVFPPTTAAAMETADANA